VLLNYRAPEEYDDLARALLAGGIKNGAELIDSETYKPHSRIGVARAPVGVSAAFLERYKFRPLEIADSSPHAGKTVAPGPLPNSFAPVCTLVAPAEADRGRPQSEAA
jgi:hypothetical protein